MKILELTDARTGTQKEYVNVDDISRIEPRMKSKSLFGSSYELSGSYVYMKSGPTAPTSVKQIPEQITKMIKNKEYLEV